MVLQCLFSVESGRTSLREIMPFCNNKLEDLESARSEYRAGGHDRCVCAARFAVSVCVAGAGSGDSEDRNSRVPGGSGE